MVRFTFSPNCIESGEKIKTAGKNYKLNPTEKPFEESRSGEASHPPATIVPLA
jgi:hypothetical protein